MKKLYQLDKETKKVCTRWDIDVKKYPPNQWVCHHATTLLKEMLTPIESLEGLPKIFWYISYFLLWQINSTHWKCNWKRWIDISFHFFSSKQFEEKKIFSTNLEMPGTEPGAFHMRSERATTALHPHFLNWGTKPCS